MHPLEVIAVVEAIRTFRRDSYAEGVADGIETLLRMIDAMPQDRVEGFVRGGINAIEQGRREARERERG